MEFTASEIERYKRHLLLPEVGESGQLALKSAKVLVIGAGGLGNAVLPYLAAAGVGNITIVDPDMVDISNLQRQVLFAEPDIGKPKAEVAARKLLAINSNISCNYIIEYFTKGNSIEIAGNHNVIIDCVDQIHTRYLINDVAIRSGVPMVYGAIHRFEGQVSVFNYQNGPTYRCAFPEEVNKSASPNCEQLGVIGVLPGIIGMYQAMETIKIITGIGQVLSGKMMLIDLLSNTHQNIQFTRNEKQVAIALGEESDISEIIDITGKELKDVLEQNSTIMIIDIRQESDVQSMLDIEVTHIPVYQFEEESTGLDKNQPVLVYCAHGINSQWATQLLKQQNFKYIYHLVGGITAL